MFIWGERGVQVLDTHPVNDHLSEHEVTQDVLRQEEGVAEVRIDSWQDDTQAAVEHPTYSDPEPHGTQVVQTLGQVSSSHPPLVACWFPSNSPCNIETT